MQLLLFLFYHPNLWDPLAKGFGRALGAFEYSDNVKTSLRGGTIYMDTGEGESVAVVMEPNYGWLENHPKDAENSKESKGNIVSPVDDKDENSNTEPIQCLDRDVNAFYCERHIHTDSALNYFIYL